MMRYTRWRAVLCMIAMALPWTASGQEVAEIPFSTKAPGSAALGGGIRGGQSMYLAADNEDHRQLDLIPLYLYDGKYVFFRGVAGGVHLYRNDVFEANVYGRYRFQHLDPDRNAFYAGIEERDQTLDAGIEIIFRQAWGELTFDFVTDTLDRHNGQEGRISYRKTWERGPWTISPYISWLWQSDNLTDYYFGVSAAEATVERPEFHPGAANWVSAGLNTTWHISNRIALFANLGFAGTDEAVVDSPLVAEEGLSTLFIGGTYLFGNARQPDYIGSSERKGEWSWRVNYGYQAEGNIVSEIDQGDFSKSPFADTHVAGLTFSKLLSEGERIDFLGKVAWFRHLEEDEGNGNFSSWAAYIMAQGRGYSDWTGDELFRYGFGFGMSYADQVPIAEQRKQASKGDNTSHFINYLELQLDFPMARMTKAKWAQPCYIGLTVVHRSGIFGTSDFLGDVSGGADWITAHLECKV